MTFGKLIVLYGINNLGKSTQARLLVLRLQKEGYPAEYLKYPIYNLEPSGSLINDYLRAGNPYQLSPREAQLLYVLNRTQFEPTLKEKLSQGIHIIAEDYIGTGLAWGIGAGVNENFMKTINSHLWREAMAFLFTGERFVKATEIDHQHETNETLMKKVKQVHEQLGQIYGWIPIAANQPTQIIHELLWQHCCTNL